MRIASPKTFTADRRYRRPLAAIDEFRFTLWRDALAMKPEAVTAMTRAASAETVAACLRIEGTDFTAPEASRLMVKKTKLKTQAAEAAAGCADALDLIVKSYAVMPLTEDLLRQLHRILFWHTTDGTVRGGDYKTGLDERAAPGSLFFETAPASQAPALTRELIATVNTLLTAQELHPLLTLAYFNAVFPAVSPFARGNGRLCQLMTVLIMLQQGYGWASAASLTRLMDNDKGRFITALRATQLTLTHPAPAWEPWFDFFTDSLTRQMLEVKDRLTLLGSAGPRLSPLADFILTQAQMKGSVTVRGLQHESRAVMATVRYHVAELVKKGLLIQCGAGPATRYSASHAAKTDTSV